MLTARRCLFCLLLIVLPLLTRVEKAVAQASPTQQEMPANTQIRGRSFYVEGAVVVLLVGGALFAVCRSSRRM